MKKLMVKGVGGCVAVLTMCVGTASAQLITYVDATHGVGGNTTMVDGSVWNPLLAPAEGTANDGVWAQRNFGNGTTIYQNGATGHTDDAHPLRTTVSGLEFGTYDIYVYFWSSNDGGGTGSWTLRASLDGGEGPWPAFPPTTGFHDPAGTVASPVFSASLDENPFTTSVMIAEGNRRLYQAHLGTVTGTSYSVFIDDLPKTSTDGSGRTWYDGVGHAVIPEPSTYALFAGLGALAFIAFRRFRR